MARGALRGSRLVTVLERPGGHASTDTAMHVHNQVDAELLLRRAEFREWAGSFT